MRAWVAVETTCEVPVVGSDDGVRGTLRFLKVRRWFTGLFIGHILVIYLPFPRPRDPRSHSMDHKHWSKAYYPDP